MADAYQIKCSTVRAYVQVLERHGKLAELVRRLPPASQSALEKLPLPSSWMDGEILDGMLEEVHRVDGEAGLRKVVEEALRQSLMPGLLGVVQTVFRIVGTSPAFLFDRFTTITRNHLRGVDFGYRALDDKSGEMTVAMASRKPLGPVWLMANRINLLGVFQVCKTNGVVDVPRLSPDGVSAVYKMRW